MIGPRSAGWTLALACVLAVTSGCGGGDDCLQNHADVPPPDPASVPETLSVAGARLVVVPQLWRDFMPPSPPRGRPLAAVIRIHEVSRRPLPSDLRLEHLWVLADSGSWSIPLTETGPPAGPSDKVKIARCGPKWGTGTRVVVLVRVQEGGVRHTLRAARVVIERTD